jgi:hypothetical protein
VGLILSRRRWGGTEMQLPERDPGTSGEGAAVAVARPVYAGATVITASPLAAGEYLRCWVTSVTCIAYANKNAIL